MQKNQLKIPAYSVEELAEISRIVALQNGRIAKINVEQHKGQRYEVIVEFPEREEAYN